MTFEEFYAEQKRLIGSLSSMPISTYLSSNINDGIIEPAIDKEYLKEYYEFIDKLYYSVKPKDLAIQIIDSYGLLGKSYLECMDKFLRKNRPADCSLQGVMRRMHMHDEG